MTTTDSPKIETEEVAPRVWKSKASLNGVSGEGSATSKHVAAANAVRNLFLLKSKSEKKPTVSQTAESDVDDGKRWMVLSGKRKDQVCRQVGIIGAFADGTEQWRVAYTDGSRSTENTKYLKLLKPNASDLTTSPTPANGG